MDMVDESRLPRDSFARIVRESEGRTGEPLNYGQIVMAKLASVFAQRDGSSNREHEIRDLERILVPYRDKGYEADMDRVASERKACVIAEKAAGNLHPNVVVITERGKQYDAHYQGWWIEALMRLMRRNGLLGTGGVRP